jgi:hypothetical protein
VRLVEQGGYGSERSRVCSGVLLVVSEFTEMSTQRCHSQFVRDDEFSLECGSAIEMHSFSEFCIAFTVIDRRAASLKGLLFGPTVALRKLGSTSDADGPQAGKTRLWVVERDTITKSFSGGWPWIDLVRNLEFIYVAWRKNLIISNIQKQN